MTRAWRRRRVDDPTVARCNVVYIAGAMRSGTTIVGQVLGSSPDALLIGELRSGMIDPELHTFCDCGRPRGECPFWSATDAVLPPSELARRATSLTALPVLLASVLLGRPLTSTIASAVAYLAGGLAGAGTQTLVDTSKTPTLVALWRLAGARVHLVLAVRNPWHVARAQARPTSVTGVPQRPVVLSLAVWLAYLAGAIVVRPLAQGGVSIARFDVFRAGPAAVARGAWARSGLAVGTPGEDGSYCFDPSHVLAGNPRRARGTVTVRPSD